MTLVRPSLDSILIMTFGFIEVHVPVLLACCTITVYNDVSNVQMDLHKEHVYNNTITNALFVFKAIINISKPIGAATRLVKVRKWEPSMRG